MENTLFYGDNIDILRGRDSQGRPYVATESVDLIYLDPPFNSKQGYNKLYTDERGIAPASIRAFEDTWHWASASTLYQQTIRDPMTPEAIRRALEAFKVMLGTSEMMAYIAMMTPRLMELHRVLKSTGSLYLHCDPTASHYLKIVLDTIFGPENFRNEIIWKRTTAHNDARRRFADISDTILWYAKSPRYIFNPQYAPYPQAYLDKEYWRVEPITGRRFKTSDLRSPSPRPNLHYEYKGYKPHPNGWTVTRERMEQLDRDGRLYYPPSPDGRIRLKNYANEMPGMLSTSLWEDIPPLHAQAAERLGYPTQKPVALLKRIIAASTGPGDLVLDPFCGCGTATAAAHELGRSWIGIDITHLAIEVIKRRLEERYGLLAGIDFRVVGEPRDIGSARALALQDREQFEYWALSLIDARPYEGRQKKGADRGRDGILIFDEGEHLPIRRAIISVKSGHVTSRDVRDLRGVIERDAAEMGIFLTLEPPSSEMKIEAAEAGAYDPPFVKDHVPRIQILSIADILDGVSRVNLPRGARVTTHRQIPPAPATKPQGIKEGQGVLLPAVALDGGKQHVDASGETKGMPKKKTRTAS